MKSAGINRIRIQIPTWLDPGHVGLVALFLLQTGILIWVGVISPQRMVVKGVDPVFYYSYLRSSAFDRDLDFRDELARLQEGGLPRIEIVPRTGRAGNVFSVGPAVFLSPFYLMGHLWASVDPRYPTDGYSPPYQILCFLGLPVYGLIGVFLCYSSAKKLFPKGIAFLAVIGGWLATSVAYYFYPIALMPHAISFCLTALFLRVWIGLRGEGPISTGRWAILGFVGGLAMLVRWQNLLFLLIPPIDRALTGRNSSENGENSRANSVLRNGSVYAGCALAAFFPQMIAWWRIYGTPLTIPQGEGFLRFAHPQLLRVLFGMDNGLISWTPIVAIGLIGLWPLAKKRSTRPLGVALIAAIAGQIYMNSIVSDVHAGMGFGLRRFVESMPIVIMGLAGALSWLGRGVRRWQMAVGMSVFILWNGLFLFQYYSGMIPWDRALTWDELVTDKIGIYRAWEGHVHRSVCQGLVRRAAKSEHPAEAGQLLSEASQEADLAIQTAPRSPESYICRALVAAAIGNREAAAEDLAEACRYYKDTEYIRRRFLSMLQRSGFAERTRAYEPFLEGK